MVWYLHAVLGGLHVCTYCCSQLKTQMHVTQNCHAGTAYCLHHRTWVLLVWDTLPFKCEPIELRRTSSHCPHCTWRAIPAAELRPLLADGAVLAASLHALKRRRSSSSDQIYASVVSVMLALMDGLKDRGQVLVIGATNRCGWEAGGQAAQAGAWRPLHSI